MSTHTSTTEQTPTPTLHPVIIRLLQKRNLDVNGIREFLSWNLKELPDLTNMQDMEKTCLRIIDAIDAKETIGIYGDYDVDGTTSCALFFHFFKMLGVTPLLIQPSRFVEGYGLHPPSVDQAKEAGIKLLITVDCGITNNEAATHAKNIGLDLIITDHHKDARDEMPDAFSVVNPNRRDEPENSPLRPLAGVAVAFAICMKVRELLLARSQQIASIYPLLQFVAIGTICDLANLTPMNMKLVRHGLKQIPETTYPGIKAFFSREEREASFIPSEKLAFHVGPYINSKGRLDHPERSLLLLTCDSQDEAMTHYNHLEVCNNERKWIQSQVFDSARKQVISDISGGELTASVVYDAEWHEGVIGIVASKLVETFKVPAVVFTNSEENGMIKASARSAGDLNIFDCLKECEDLFSRFGGHKAAAGLSMPKENYRAFRERFLRAVKSRPIYERSITETYDLEIKAEEISYELVKALDLLEPFGMGNSKPKFKTSGLKLESFDLLKDVHVRWNFKTPSGQSLKGISFNYISKWGVIHPEEIYRSQQSGQDQLSVIFTLGINRFNGREFLQLMVDSVAIGNLA